MNPIRPSLTPPLSANVGPKPADAARLAAQRAFFEIAAGKAPQAARPVQASAPTTEARALARLQPMLETRPEQPARPLRPGSLLDIRV